VCPTTPRSYSVKGVFDSLRVELRGAACRRFQRQVEKIEAQFGGARNLFERVAGRVIHQAEAHNCFSIRRKFRACR
jgi:hypothetical protein